MLWQSWFRRGTHIPTAPRWAAGIPNPSAGHRIGGGANERPSFAAGGRHELRQLAGANTTSYHRRENLAFGALTLLGLPLSTRRVLPAFGVLLSGAIGSLVCVALAGLWGYCAWAAYRLRPAAWWIVLITICLARLSPGLRGL
jgi:hypothetical protein